jgi:hypothetical protein
MKPRAHPSTDSLAAYGNGQLDNLVAGRIAKHLETCADCRQQVAAIAASLPVVAPTQRSKDPAELFSFASQNTSAKTKSRMGQSRRAKSRTAFWIGGATLLVGIALGLVLWTTGVFPVQTSDSVGKNAKARVQSIARNFPPKTEKGSPRQFPKKSAQDSATVPPSTFPDGSQDALAMPPVNPNESANESSLPKSGADLPRPADEAPSVADAENAILALYDSDMLFNRAEAKTVTAAFATLFERKNADAIRRAYGEEQGAFSKYLNDRADLKNTFYTALDEVHDHLPRALALFKEMWEKYPGQFEKWGQLAIAVAVVWDKPDRGVYDHAQHQRRTKSIMPAGQAEALDNFTYIVDAEKKLLHPVHLYPWEFLAFVVDHRTPLVEREWAFKYHQYALGKVKSWHQDVPYDHDMLQSEVKANPDLEPRLARKDYTLANVRMWGGVCAQQADFASRTARSLGAPAAYCWGDSAYTTIGHAWWLHVHISSVSKDEIKFALISDGRYEGFEKHKFYTGNVTDPQTGQIVMDRDLERRLWIAGGDRVGHRLNTLLARAFPLVVEKRGLDANAKLAYIDKMMKINKYDEFAWRSLADMVAAGELAADQKKLVLARLQSLSLLFVNYPDFVNRLFPPMLEVATPAEKTKIYEQAMALFEVTNRPDLSCDARLRFTELLLAENKTEAAAKGLLATIRKFPTEGRYIPKLAAKLEELAPKFKGGVQQTAQLYLELLPAMILHYRTADERFCKEIESQAKAFLQANDQKVALAQLERGIAIASLAIKGRQ